MRGIETTTGSARFNRRSGQWPRSHQGRPVEDSSSEADRPEYGTGLGTRRLKDPASASKRREWVLPALLGSAAALGSAALYAVLQAREAERRHPPIGRFMTVDGVRLHYVERGRGEPLVLIHGNGTMIEDLVTSGLVEDLVSRYRVIVFDRPGFGYSERPRRLWTPQAHARLFHKALTRLGVEKAVVFGHSWGTLVAIALALDFPFLVRGLVLASGYYFPTVRADTFLLSPPAIPVIGDVMRYTISPLAARLMLPQLVRKMFAPAPVPEHFDRLMPKELMLRPSQLRASAEDTALMVPAAMNLQKRYRELTVPVVIVTGADDQIVDAGRQSERLHREIENSELVSLPGLGHMVHHMAPEEAAKGIDRVSARSTRRQPPAPASEFAQK